MKWHRHSFFGNSLRLFDENGGAREWRNQTLPAFKLTKLAA